MSQLKAAPLVSIVITTKNEAKNIGNCLQSISLQSYENIETIVVDNNSTDDTTKIAKAFDTLVFSKGPERSAQRNFGMIGKSTGKYVIYIDADMILSPQLINACVDHLESSDALALHIPEIVLGKRFFSRVRNFERSFYNGTVIDGARFFNREAFTAVGGFDEELFKEGSGEDWDIDKKIKQIGHIEMLQDNLSLDIQKHWTMGHLIENLGITHKINFNGIYHNESEINIGDYFKKKFYYGKGFDGYIKKWGKKDPDIKKQFGFFYRFIGVFFEQGRWRKLISKPRLSAGMYFLRIVVGFSYLLHKL